jgi:hypothetical protein
VDRFMERHRLLEAQPSHGFLPFPDFLLVSQKPLAQVFDDGPSTFTQFGLWQPRYVGQILAAPDPAQDTVRKFFMMCFDEMD